MIHDIVCFFAMVAPTVTVLHQLYPASNGKRLLLLSLLDSQQESEKTFAFVRRLVCQSASVRTEH